MKNKIKNGFVNTSLAKKIRISYLLLVIPLFILLLFCIITLNRTRSQYSEMINSALLAGDFSLDFKKDFDYETYLLIVGNKTPEESTLGKLLEDANRVIDDLMEENNRTDNVKRLESVKKYLYNLEKYIGRIEKNLREDSSYEDNMEIWENDVQIVTALIKEEIFNYIFVEIKDMQAEKESMDAFYERAINGCAIAFIVLTLMLIVFSIYLPNSITKPITDLVNITKRISAGDLEVRSRNISLDEVGELSRSMNQMIDKINELLSQITKEQIRIREAELELLQAQINPHFLYNTLDTIIWLAEGGDEKLVVSMVKSLSNFFRTSLSRGKELVTIKEELVHAKSYLEIQHFRYRDILEFEITVPEELEDYLIPKITIQPLIENALYHGIKNKRGGGKIFITAVENENDVIISVKDNGIGMSPERLEEVIKGLNSKEPSEQSIYGLYNVNERIKIKFGDDYGITLHSVFGEGTDTNILLPKSIK